VLPILDNDAMREADRHTIEDLQVPGLVLMENAATGVVDAIRERYPEASEILILCGRGNNGGDGLAVARHLHNGGCSVRLLLFADPQRLSPDAAANFRMAEAFGVPITVVADDSLSPLLALLDESPPELVVDALLGTGLDRPLAGRLAAVVEMANSCTAPVVAVDVPTGLSGASSKQLGLTLEADLTVTFAALKRCHVLPPACLLCGEVVVADIGIPPAALEQGCSLHLVQAEDIALLLPERRADAHKGRFGHLLLVAGAAGRGGAVAMAARSAVVSGAGLVTMAVPEPVVPVVDAACLEAMTHPMASDELGAFAGPDGLAPLLERMTTVAVGPGMGIGTGAESVLSWLLSSWTGPLLLDADAVNLLAGKPESLRDRNAATVLTPHPGELGRLLERSTAEVVDDRLGAAMEAAERSRSVIVAKGFQTIVATPDGDAWVNPTGDSHLGSGGSGDVLTGTIAGLLAQGLEPERACLVGCWLHGRAGELGGEVYPAATPAAVLPGLLAAAWQELLEVE
jgi:NAD(P)H-hydrate epimerase